MHPLVTPLAKIHSDARLTSLKKATITDFHLPDMNAWDSLVSRPCVSTFIDFYENDNRFSIIEYHGAGCEACH